MSVYGKWFKIQIIMINSKCGKVYFVQFRKNRIVHFRKRFNVTLSSNGDILLYKTVNEIPILTEAEILLCSAIC